jgi:hypothetical protein
MGITYEEWREEITKNGNHHQHWQHAGDWFFPTPMNNSEIWRDKFYHICEMNWELDTADGNSAVACKQSCHSCGEEIPDGIKMIAALLTW